MKGKRLRAFEAEEEQESNVDDEDEFWFRLVN